jgi:DNA polymerase-3 subunit epsilon
MTGWHLGPLTALDTESTGVSVYTDRIVTGYAATLDSRAAGRRTLALTTVLVDPGVDIPQGATDVHGVTTEYARTKGMLAPDGVNAIVRHVADSLGKGIPVVGYNLAYDLSLLYWECLCWDIPTVAERLGLAPDAMVGPIIDAYVIDKQVNPYVRGSGQRKLEPTAARYGVDLANAHTADADAMAAARVAVAIGTRWPEIGGMGLRELHIAQKAWRAEQQRNLQGYFRAMRGQYDAYCDPCWPICVDPAHEALAFPTKES